MLTKGSEPIVSGCNTILSEIDRMTNIFLLEVLLQSIRKDHIRLRKGKFWIQ